MAKRPHTRRSLRNAPVIESINFQAGEESTQLPDHPPRDLISLLRPATIRQRKREWERSNKTKTYRGVSPLAHTAVKEAASENGCSIDQAATAFLEYAVYCQQRGDTDLSLEPVLRRGRWTLFPNNETGSASPRQKVGWSEKIWELKTPKTKDKSTKPAVNPAPVKPWRDWPWVGYRLPGAVVQAIDSLRFDKNVPAGEVVTRLLEHASKAYRAGRLVLTPKISDPEDR